MSSKANKVLEAIRTLANNNPSKHVSRDEIASIVPGDIETELDTLKQQGFIERVTLEMVKLKANT